MKFFYNNLSWKGYKTNFLKNCVYSKKKIASEEEDTLEEEEEPFKFEINTEVEMVGVDLNSWTSYAFEMVKFYNTIFVFFAQDSVFVFF